MNLQALRAELRRVEAQRLTRLKAQVEEVIAKNPKLAEVRSQIRLDLTPDGLRIQIVDDQNRPMFDLGSATVKDYMRDLLREIGGVLNSVENRVSLSGHTDSAPYGSGERGYSNWELSADRANASRRELVAGGMNESKVVRVIGLGPSLMYDKDNPRNPMNRRIMIMVLNHDAEERVFQGTESTRPTARSSRPRWAATPRGCARTSTSQRPGKSPHAADDGAANWPGGAPLFGT